MSLTGDELSAIRIKSCQGIFGDMEARQIKRIPSGEKQIDETSANGVKMPSARKLDGLRKNANQQGAWNNQIVQVIDELFHHIGTLQKEVAELKTQKI